MILFSEFVILLVFIVGLVGIGLFILAVVASGCIMYRKMRGSTPRWRRTY